MCCSDTQGWLGFPWPPKRGWAKTCATLPWPIRGWSLQVVFFLLTRRSPLEGSGCQGGDPGRSHGEGACARALTQERAQRYIAAPSSRKNRSGQMQARGAAPEPARPRRLPGHGKPSTAARPPQHRARQATDARQPGGAHTTPAWTRPSSGPPDRRKRLCARARRRSAAPASTETPRYYCRTSVVPTQSASIRTGVNELMSRAVPHVDNHPLST